MKRFYYLVAGAALCLSSCGATLAVRGTTPTQLNDGTCTAPILLSASTLQVVHAQVVGQAREDSLSLMPGAPFNFSWQIPAGSYQVRVWSTVSGRPDLAGCDTTATFQAPTRPGRVRDLRAG